MTDRNKIAVNLTPEELQEFLKRCAQVKGLTLAKIQTLANEWGIDISPMSARSFRKSTFGRYLEEMKRKREMAEMVSGAAKSGLSLSDAAASMLSQKIFDRLLNAGEMTDEETNEMSLALSRLRLGDQRAKILEAKLAEMEGKLAAIRKETSKVAEDDSLTAEQRLAKIRKGLKL